MVHGQPSRSNAGATDLSITTIWKVEGSAILGLQNPYEFAGCAIGAFRMIRLCAPYMRKAWTGVSPARSVHRCPVRWEVSLLCEGGWRPRCEHLLCSWGMSQCRLLADRWVCVCPHTTVCDQFWPSKRAYRAEVGSSVAYLIHDCKRS